MNRQSLTRSGFSRLAERRRAQLLDDTGSAVAAAVFVMPLVMLVAVAVTTVIADSARCQQLRAVTIAAAHDAAVSQTWAQMHAAAVSRVRRQFPTAQVTVRRIVGAGLVFAQVDSHAPALPVPGIGALVQISARAHAVVESQ